MEKWKKNKNKIIGYYCGYVPEEILHAMGFLPYRMRATGCKDTALADAILSHFNCSFVRCSLNLALEGKFDFLDGLTIINSCDHVRRLFDIWKRKVNTDKDFPLFFISVPHLVTDHGRGWYHSEIDCFIKSLEKRFKIKLEEEKLVNSIKVYNENRQILRKINELRAVKEPKITGSDFYKLMVSNSSIPKEICNQELNQIHGSLREKSNLASHRARLMLVGSFVDNPDFISIFEDVGAQIVSDSLCLGLRNIWDDTKITKKPLQGLVDRYYEKIACPRMMNRHSERLEFIVNQVKSTNADGVVVQRLEFCDLHGVDNMLLQHDLEDLGIPVLNIDREYLMGDIGRFKTRVEAFIEQLLVG